MKRRSIIAGALTIAAIVASLAACSSDSESTGDAIDGVQSGDPSVPAESSSPESDPGPSEESVDRPEIELPEDLEVIIEETATDDPIEEVIFLDNAERVKVNYAALAARETQHPAISFYFEGEAQARTIDILQGIIEDNIVSAGTVRYFNRSVEILDGESAIVKYCRDFSEIYEVDVESGATINETEPAAKATLYTERVELNETGVWHAVLYGTDSESPECQ